MLVRPRPQWISDPLGLNSHQIGAFKANFAGARSISDRNRKTMGKLGATFRATSAESKRLLPGLGPISTETKFGRFGPLLSQHRANLCPLRSSQVWRGFDKMRTKVGKVGPVWILAQVTMIYSSHSGTVINQPGGHALSEVGGWRPSWISPSGKPGSRRATCLM